MPVKQLIVKQSRDYRARDYKEFSLSGYISQAKGAESSCDGC